MSTGADETPDQEDNPLGTPENVRILREALDEQALIGVEIMGEVRSREGEVWTLMFLLLYAVHDSASSLRILVDAGRVRDSYVVARVIFETALNACFIFTDGYEAASRARRHSDQRSARDLDRLVQIAGSELRLKRSGAEELLASPEVQRLIDEFTSKKGREKPWTDESVRQRIEQIHAEHGQRVSTGLRFGYLLYGHASEIAHGSAFGALFSLGLTDPSGPRRSHEIGVHFNEQLCLVLALVLLSVNSLVRLLAPAVDRDDLAERSEQFAKGALRAVRGRQP